MADKHEECTQNDCLCEIETNHNEKKSDGISDFIKDWNEVAANIESTPKEIIIKVKHSDPERIDLVATRLINKYNFKTAEESNTVYLHTGKIYDNKKAEAIIRKETEIQIENCTKHDTLEVIEKIKRKTFEDLKDFDSDPNVLTLENGILNLQTMELSPHTPTNYLKF